jgi:hypothetical protein
MRTDHSVRSIPQFIGAENAARGNVDDTAVVDIAAALRRQKRNDPGKNSLAIIFLFWAFHGEESRAFSRPSPQSRQ